MSTTNMVPEFPDLGSFLVVRLNARISPMDEYESSLYRKYNISPVPVEANTPEELIPRVADCDALLVVSTALPAPVIESLTRCRVISRLGIGTDKIDVDTASKLGIIVANVPGCFSEEMADHTMGFILALARKFPQMSRAMEKGAWSRSRALSMQNRRLSECTLGLVGFGDSARLVAQRARAFGMRLLAARRNPTMNDPAALELGVKIVDLETLLAESDFVSLHLPLNPVTYHLFDRTLLHKLKRGAYLINTARGSIVDEDALVEALREGYLGGAGLDTFEHIDPFTGVDAPVDHPLLSFDNVVLTPHVAALSVEAMQAVALGGIENIVAVLSGRLPLAERIVNTGITPIFPLMDR